MRKFKKSGFLKNKSFNIVSRFFLSSFIVISFFYVAPIIINFTDKNFNNKEFTNNSKNILNNTLNKDKLIEEDTTADADDHSIPVAARLPGATALPTEYVSPTMMVARMGRLLDQQQVDKDGRWIVIDPVMMEILMDEDSRLLNADFGDAGGLRNGLVLNNWNGFRVYVSNNLPAVGTGPGTTGTTAQDDNFGVVVAGHDSAVATAEQINKTETYRDPDSFADIVRGMHLYGRKILRPEALVTARYNLA